MTFTPNPKNSSTFGNESRNSSTFAAPLKHGKSPSMEFLKDLTFTDDPYDDGRELKDLTFNDLGDQTWTNETQH